MRRALVLTLALFLSSPALAAPVCGSLYNSAPYTVRGHLATDTTPLPDGTLAHHQENFQISPEGRVQFCTEGPFFEGERLELTIKTLFPIFSCRTKVDQEIIIMGRHKPEGGTETTALCR